MNNFELPTFEKIKYLKNPVTDENCGVAIIINDKEQIQVTLNTENKYYAEIIRQVDAGELTIKDADYWTQ